MKTMLTILALVLPITATAQEVWRCGPDGHSYSNLPCTDGSRIDVGQQPRPAADLQAASAQAAREQRLADALRRERQMAEAAQRGNGLTGFGQAAGVKPEPKAPLPKRSKRHPPRPADADTWRAVAPASRHTKG